MSGVFPTPVHRPPGYCTASPNSTFVLTYKTNANFKIMEGKIVVLGCT